MTTPQHPRPDDQWRAQSWSDQQPPAAPSGQPQPGDQPAGYPGYADQPTAEDRTWAMVSHLGSFLAAWFALGLICPLLVLIAKSRRPFVRAHAYESLNFQLNALMLAAIYVVLGVVTLGVGLALGLPFVLAYIVWYAYLVIKASMAANAGQPYRYPAIVRFVNP